MRKIIAFLLGLMIAPAYADIATVESVQEMEQTIRTGLAHKVDAAGYDPDLVLQTDDTGKVIAGKVQTEHFADGAVTREKIADGALTNVAFSMNASDLIDMTKLHLPNIPKKGTGKYVFMYNVDADEFVFEPLATSEATYTFLEYIETNGSQWIDTGVLPALNQEFETIYMPMSDTFELSNLLCTTTRGSGGSATNRFYPLGTNKRNQWRVAYGNTDVYGTMTWGQYHNVYVRQKSITVDGVTTNISNSLTTSTIANSNMILFGNHNKDNGIYPYIKARLKFLKIYQGGTAIRHFIPARRNNDRVLGLYDAVNKKFYVNQGGGTFIAGPDL